MEWSYTNRVSPERQKSLLAAPDFDGIARRIVEQMQIISFDIHRGNRGEVKGCKRPEFALQVSEETFDLFYNSSRGYRGQYLRSPEDGERANSKLISMMSDRLIYYAKDTTIKHTLCAKELGRSLEAGSAKSWINEKGDRAQRGDDIRHLIVDLKVEPWVGTAKEYVATPAKYPDPNKEIKAVDGVKAPTGTVLEVKGAYFDENGNEHIAEDKKDRSLQIHLYGFT